jgi:hypothetical protein
MKYKNVDILLNICNSVGVKIQKEPILYQWLIHSNKNQNICLANILIFCIYLFKLHITPIWVKQLQYKSMQT